MLGSKNDMPPEAPPLHNDGLRIQTRATTTYLGVTATARAMCVNVNLKRIQNAIKAGHNLRRLGLHWGTLSTANMLRVWKNTVPLNAMYAIYLTPLTNEIAHGWDDLEKLMIINAMGCFSEKTGRGSVR